MREILFRGKTERGKWVKGVPFFEENRCYIIEDLFICDEYECTGAVNYSVIPETVGQYTGLTDKNGKKIFEGDILDCGDRVVYVKWHDFCGTWDSIFIKYKGELHSNGVSVVDWKYRAIIIGNIHDNPELLKDGE